MKRHGALTVVTDSTPEAAALRAWLARSVGPFREVDAFGAGDVAVVVEARRRSQTSERILTLTAPAIAGADVDGSAALAAVRAWLQDMGPFDRRIHGADVIAREIGRGAGGAADVTALVGRLTGRTAGLRRRMRAGRPRGSTRPFHGVELDVCVTLLLHEGRGWSERDLARETGRSTFGVHRALVALDDRGYLVRARGDTRLKDPTVLRDDLAEAWRERLGSRRDARGFIAPRPSHVLDDVQAALRPTGRQALLAGPSAVEGAAAPVGGSLVLYLEDEAADALLPADFSPTSRLAVDLVVWPVIEHAVLLAPRRLESTFATNRVITFMDLVALGVERYREAADAVWEGP